MSFTIDYADGTSEEKEILSVFTAESGRMYAAMVTSENGGEYAEAPIELFRVFPTVDENGGETFGVEVIDTEEELDIAVKAFFQNGSPLPSFSVRSEGGAYEGWIIVDVFSARDREYAALIPKEVGDTADHLKIHLMRLDTASENGVEGFSVSAIQSDMEYDEVASIFAKRFESE